MIHPSYIPGPQLLNLLASKLVVEITFMKMIGYQYRTPVLLPSRSDPKGFQSIRVFGAYCYVLKP